MEALNSIVGAINGVVWGPLMLVLILGVGFFLQVGLKFMPILKLGTGFSLLFKGREGLVASHRTQEPDTDDQSQYDRKAKPGARDQRHDQQNQDC